MDGPGKNALCTGMHRSKLPLFPGMYPWVHTKTSLFPLYPIPVLLRMPCFMPGYWTQAWEASSRNALLLAIDEKCKEGSSIRINGVSQEKLNYFTWPQTRCQSMICWKSDFSRTPVERKGCKVGRGEQCITSKSVPMRLPKQSWI